MSATLHALAGFFNGGPTSMAFHFAKGPRVRVELADLAGNKVLSALSKDEPAGTVQVGVNQNITWTVDVRLDAPQITADSDYIMTALILSSNFRGESSIACHVAK